VVGELDAARVAELVDRLPAPVRLLHLHVSDWLIADATADPDRVIDGLAGAAAARGLALSVTLHDLPGPGDPPELGARRAATYRRLVDAAAGVAVCSEHERSLLHERVAPGRAVTVIPLPIDPLAAHPSPPAGGDGGGGDGGEPTVAIFGFLYPGKGHRDVIEELAEFGPPVTVLAIGRPSARHPDLVDELAEAARARGLSFRCTGYVPEEQVLDRLRAPVIPVAPQTNISASGSINSWLTAGRRPLVRATPPSWAGGYRDRCSCTRRGRWRTRCVVRRRSRPPPGCRPASNWGRRPRRWPAATWTGSPAWPGVLTGRPAGPGPARDPSRSPAVRSPCPRWSRSAPRRRPGTGRAPAGSPSRRP
jgi:hypothetical protein